MSSPDEVRVFAADTTDGPVIDGTLEAEPPVDVAIAPADRTQSVIEGLPDDAQSDAHAHAAASAARAPTDSAAQQASQQASQQAAQQAAQQAVTVDASATTDPHHDYGSSAVGHVEDATPDTHGAGPPEAPEPTHEPEPTPEPEAPPPPVEPTHDAAATTAPDDSN